MHGFASKMRLNTLQLSLQFGDLADAALHRAALPRHKVARWIRHALDTDAEITVRIVDAQEGQALNRDYRHKDYATNVLTFDYTQAPLVTADLVLCAPVVAKEARENRKTLERHSSDGGCCQRGPGESQDPAGPLRPPAGPWHPACPGLGP